MATPRAHSTSKRRHTEKGVPPKLVSTSQLSNGRVQPAAAAARTFTRGAVIKLRLENFLTFDRVIICPKPQLNVIVGPNGTGKSSIVCAICLGLGGSTTLLGRARDLKDFVKHGKEVGFVEITLYDDRAPKHPVIRRTLSATSNSSEWTINRKSALEKDVKKLVESLNIQLDNRCMFLPQDKVIEFARMNKQELLVETERALGPKELFQHHEELKGLKTKHSDALESLKRKRKESEDLVRQNNLIQRDVERFQNKEKYEKDIRHLFLKKLWVEYEDVSNDYYKKRREHKTVTDDLAAIKEHYKPIRDQLKRQEDAVTRDQAVAQEAMGDVRRAENVVRDHQNKLVGLGDKVEEPRQELENLKKQEGNRKKKITNLQREIEGFKRELEELEPIDSLNPKIAEKNSNIRRIQKEIDEISEQQGRMMTEHQQLEDVIKQAKQELEQMNSIRVQRLQKLEQRESDTVRAIRWLEENQHRFKQPILEPVCMSLNVLDPRFVKQAEAFFGGRDFFSFVAQNEEDRETFLKAVRDSSMRLRVNIVRAPNHSLGEFQPKIPFSTLKGYGFQQMLLGVVDAPEPVLCFFCQYQKLHCVPIAGKLRMEQVDRITTELQELQNFFTADTRYSVKQSRYRRDTSTRTMELFPPRFLVASVDNQRKQELEAEIEEKMASLANLRAHSEDLGKQDQQLRRQDSKLRNEKQELRKIVDSYKSHRTNIRTRENKLEQHLATTFNIPEAEEKCEQEVNKIQEERLECLCELKELVQRALACTDASLKAALNVCTAENKVGFFLKQFRQAKNTYEEAEQNVKTLTTEVSELKRKARLVLDKATKETGCKDVQREKPELHRILREFPSDLGVLDDRIYELQAKADMCMGTDGSIVDEYKAREQKISELTLEIANIKSSIDHKDERIQELKESWLVPLNNLIGQVNSCFRSYFSQHMGMESAGEVRLDPDPETQPDFSEFDKYGVQIKVKFRNNEQLQELDAQRQSGGERSVSTMLYLMALQGNTSCPFRVVDEINQGMDPINERRIFNLIVQSAHEGAQYFLLTPKLLQNLEYSDAVAIHLVHNGQEMMECETWSLSKILG